MLVVKISNNNPGAKLISLAVEIIKSGGVVVIPTETAYGLAGDATNREAVRKIYRIKGRGFKKFLPLICSDMGQVKKYFRPGAVELELLKKYKGLSVVLPLKHESIKTLKQNIFLMPGQENCAVRISTNKIANKLAKKLGRPITATSANRSGEGNCYRVEELREQFNLGEGDNCNCRLRGDVRLIDLILDAGELKKRKPSTMVKVSNGMVKVLRQGEVIIQRAKH